MMKIIVSIFSIYQLSFGNRLLLYRGFQAPPQPQALSVPPQQPIFPVMPGVPFHSAPAQPVFPWQQYPHNVGLDWDDDADYDDLNNFYGTGGMPQMPAMGGMPQANIQPDLSLPTEITETLMRVIYQSWETEIDRFAEEQAARLKERFSEMASAARVMGLTEGERAALVMETTRGWQEEQDRIYRELRERWYSEQVEPLIQRFDDGVKEAILAELTTHSQQLLEEIREQQLREKEDQLSAFMESIMEKEKEKEREKFLPPQTL